MKILAIMQCSSVAYFIVTQYIGRNFLRLNMKRHEAKVFSEQICVEQCFWLLNNKTFKRFFFQIHASY